MTAKSSLLFALLLGAFLSNAHADISMPQNDNFYDKMGRGLANLVNAPSEIVDSIYTLNELEGPTVAWSKGLVQGVSRMMMDLGDGLGETLTAPLPVGPHSGYQTWKSAPYDSMIVSDYPPSDLKNFY